MRSRMRGVHNPMPTPGIIIVEFTIRRTSLFVHEDRAPDGQSVIENWWVSDMIAIIIIIIIGIIIISIVDLLVGGREDGGNFWSWRGLEKNGKFDRGHASEL